MPTRQQARNAKPNQSASASGVPDPGAGTPGQPDPGAGASGQPNSGAGASGQSDPPNVRPIENCGTFAQAVDDHCIGCDKCELWVHATEMCSGLPQKVIDVILEYSGEGINYMCMKCRVARASNTSRGGSPTKSESFMADTLGQLFQHLRGMSSILTNLSAQVKALTTQHEAPAPTPPTHNPAPTQPHTSQSTQGTPSYSHILSQGAHTSPTSLDQYKLIVRKELREMHERDKRRDSIIIRGLKATTPRGVVAEFAEITQRKMGTRVEVSDVVIIPGHTGICRAKIYSSAERKLVLEQAKGLKNTEYKHVYVRRDLTYAQRGELKLRREAEAAGRNTEGAPPAPNPGNHETIPKTVFSNDEMPRAAEGRTSPTTCPPPGNPEQGTEPLHAPSQNPVCRTSPSETTN